MLVFLAATNSRDLAQPFSIPASTQAGVQWPPDPQVQALTLLPGYGCVLGSSEVCTLPSECLWSQAPSQCALSPWCLGFGLLPPTTPQERQVGCRVQRRLELLLQGNSPKCPRGSFSFLENSPAQSRCSIQGRACPLTQPTSPARPGTVQSAPTVSMCLPLRPYSPPCNFKQPGLCRCCSSLV